MDPSKEASVEEGRISIAAFQVLKLIAITHRWASMQVIPLVWNDLTNLTRTAARLCHYPALRPTRGGCSTPSFPITLGLVKCLVASCLGRLLSVASR